MTPEQIQHVRELLIQACDQHLVNGGTIRTGWFIHETNRCPVGCLLGDQADKELWKVAAANKILGLASGSDELWYFIRAFDGTERGGDSDSPLTALGRELREKYLGK